MINSLLSQRARNLILATALLALSFGAVANVPSPAVASSLASRAFQRGKRVSTDSGKLSLVVPAGWKSEIIKEGKLLGLSNDENRVFAIVIDLPISEAMPIEELAKLLTAQYGEGFKNAKASRKRTVNITASIKGEQVDVPAKIESRDFLARVTTFSQSGSLFVVHLIGDAAGMKAVEADATAMLASIEISEKIYGLERSKTVVLSGGRPEPQWMDPAQNAGSAAGYAGMLFSGLTRLTPQLQVAPDLAESWNISADGRVYTFKLRSGAAFADKRPITAEDVRYSWERTAGPKMKSDSASTYLGDIAGYRDFAAGKSKTIQGLKVVDERTLQVTLDGPKAYFLAKLTYPTAFIYDQRDVKKDAKNWPMKANASGPFRIKEMDADRYVTFEANPAYHQQAKVKNIVFLVRPGGSQFSLYQAGGIDLVGLGQEDAAAVSAEDHPQNKELASTSNLCTTMMQFDISKAPLDDIEVRRAMIQSIDFAQLEKIREFEYADADSWSVLPSGFPGYVERERALKFDPKAAKAAILKSKYAGKVPKIVYTTSNSNNRDDTITPALIGMWQKNLGVKVEVEYREPENFVGEARKKHGNIVPFGWCADYPDPENFLDVLFHSEAGYNVAAMKDAELDKMLEAARSESDPAARIALYQKAETRIQDQALALIYPRVDSFELVKPYIKGYVPTGIGVQQLHLISIEGFAEPAN